MQLILRLQSGDGTVGKGGQFNKSNYLRWQNFKDFCKKRKSLWQRPIGIKFSVLIIFALTRTFHSEATRKCLATSSRNHAKEKIPEADNRIEPPARSSELTGWAWSSRLSLCMQKRKVNLEVGPHWKCLLKISWLKNESWIWYQINLKSERET